MTFNIYTRLDIFLWTDNIKYLGLNLDNKLNFTHHTNFISLQGICMLIKLFPLLNRSSNLCLQNKLLICKSIVRLILSYSCPTWNFTSNTNIKKLQTVQNKFLRVIGNYPRRTKIEKIHKELSIETIKAHLNKLTICFVYFAL